MTNRMDNLQTAFDRTDWDDLAKGHNALLIAVVNAEMHDRFKNKKGLRGLLNWLTVIEEAAKMDGYRVDAIDDMHRAR